MGKQCDETQARTQALWSEIAQDLGLSDLTPKFRSMKVNSRYVDSRCALGVTLSDGAKLVLRADFGEDRSGRYQHIVARHRAAAQGLEHVVGTSVPQILWQHPTRRITVMDFAPGETAFRELDLCDFGMGDRARTLERIGDAIAKLHACSRTKNRKFWPKHNLELVSQRAEALRSGQTRMRKQAKFLGLCAYLHRAGRRARGAPFEGALEHGDLHLRNILMTEEQVSFIDFANHNNAVPQNDIATMWLANCPDHLAQDGAEIGYGSIAEKDWNAFLKGYGQDCRLDPVFQFCFALRLFKVWRRLPAPAEPMDQGAQTMAKGLVSVFDWLIENEPD